MAQAWATDLGADLGVDLDEGSDSVEADSLVKPAGPEASDLVVPRPSLVAPSSQQLQVLANRLAQTSTLLALLYYFCPRESASADLP